MRQAGEFGRKTWDALRGKADVIGAVMLRDMKTRFFHHGLGFLIVPLWPLVHMLVLLLIYSTLGRKAPFGDSLDVFFATGLIPTLAFMYISRFMSLSLILNRPMLAFPAVKTSDILIARAILEVLAACLTLLFLMLVLTAVGEDPFPYDPLQAVLAYLSAILLAVGVGSLVGVLVMINEGFATAYALSLLLVYVSSGTLFVASSLPSFISGPLSWNPILQTVEWMRCAYFETYSDELVSKTYLVSFGTIALCLGLLFERIFRRQLLE